MRRGPHSPRKRERALLDASLLKNMADTHTGRLSTAAGIHHPLLPLQTWTNVSTDPESVKAAASASTPRAATPASAPCSTRVSVAGLKDQGKLRPSALRPGPMGRRLGPCLGACRSFLLGWPPGGTRGAASLLLPPSFPQEGPVSCWWTSALQI